MEPDTEGLNNCRKYYFYYARLWFNLLWFHRKLLAFHKPDQFVPTLMEFFTFLLTHPKSAFPTSQSLDLISGTSGKVPGYQEPIIIGQVKASAADSPWKAPNSLQISLKQEEILYQGLQESALWHTVWFPEYNEHTAAVMCQTCQNLQRIKIKTRQILTVPHWFSCSKIMIIH